MLRYILSASVKLPSCEDFATRDVPPYVFVACLQDLTDTIARAAAQQKVVPGGWRVSLNTSSDAI